LARDNGVVRIAAFNRVQITLAQSCLLSSVMRCKLRRRKQTMLSFLGIRLQSGAIYLIQVAERTASRCVTPENVDHIAEFHSKRHWSSFDAAEPGVWKRVQRGDRFSAPTNTARTTSPADAATGRSIQERTTSAFAACATPKSNWRKLAKHVWPATAKVRRSADSVPHKPTGPFVPLFNYRERITCPN
jgi:hypothetical protein